MAERNAVYPLSADPIHNGHIYTIQAAIKTRLFDRLHVAIGLNAQKNPLFNIKERLILAKKAIAPLELDNIIIEPFQGMMAHYAYERNANTIIRGSRIGSDFDYEQKLAEYNRRYGLITYVVPSVKEVGDISSSFLKEVIKSGGLIAGLTHPEAKQALEERIQKISLIGVTGNMGCGKSTFCEELESKGRAAGMQITHYDIDKRLHMLYKAEHPSFPWLYEEMKRAFGEEVCNKDGVNRKILAPIIWGSEEKRDQLAKILGIPFRIEFEKIIRENEGIVLIDAAYLAEYSILDWVNYNIILVSCDEEKRKKRVMERDRLSKTDIENRMKAQYPQEQLRQEIMRQQKEVGHRFFYEHKSEQEDIDKLIETLKNEFPLFKTK